MRESSSYLFLCLSALLALGLAACVSSGDDPDGDDRRGKAQPITIGQVVTDKINANSDDVVDWKLIEVPSAGILTVNIFWDDAEIQSVTALADKFGKILQEEQRDPRAPQD